MFLIQSLKDILKRIIVKNKMILFVLWIDLSKKQIGNFETQKIILDYQFETDSIIKS